MINDKHRAEFARAVINRQFEKTQHGIYMPKQKVFFEGYWQTEVIRNGVSLGVDIPAPNTVVNEGLDHFLDVTLSAATQLTTWYVGIFEGDYTPVAGDTASSIATNATESTAYDESVRQTWTEAGVSSQSITNSASKATFTINATKTMYGALLISDSTKGGASGTLLAAGRFSASRDVVDDDQMLITYTFTAADA